MGHRCQQIARRRWATTPQRCHAAHASRRGHAHGAVVVPRYRQLDGNTCIHRVNPLGILFFTPTDRGHNRHSDARAGARGSRGGTLQVVSKRGAAGTRGARRRERKTRKKEGAKRAPFGWRRRRGLSLPRDLHFLVAAATKAFLCWSQAFRSWVASGQWGPLTAVTPSSGHLDQLVFAWRQPAGPSSSWHVRHHNGIANAGARRAMQAYVAGRREPLLNSSSAPRPWELRGCNASVTVSRSDAQHLRLSGMSAGNPVRRRQRKTPQRSSLAQIRSNCLLPSGPGHSHCSPPPHGTSFHPGRCKRHCRQPPEDTTHPPCFQMWCTGANAPFQSLAMLAFSAARICSGCGWSFIRETCAFVMLPKALNVDWAPFRMFRMSPERMVPSRICPNLRSRFGSRAQGTSWPDESSYTRGGFAAGLQVRDHLPGGPALQARPG